MIIFGATIKFFGVQSIAFTLKATVFVYELVLAFAVNTMLCSIASETVPPEKTMNEGLTERNVRIGLIVKSITSLHWGV